jgi:hypothetical protein
MILRCKTEYRINTVVHTPQYHCVSSVPNCTFVSYMSCVFNACA